LPGRRGVTFVTLPMWPTGRSSQRHIKPKSCKSGAADKFHLSAAAQCRKKRCRSCSPPGRPNRFRSYGRGPAAATLKGIHLCRWNSLPNTRACSTTRLKNGHYISAKASIHRHRAAADTGAYFIGTSLRHCCNSGGHFELLDHHRLIGSHNNPGPNGRELSRRLFSLPKRNRMFGPSAALTPC